MSNGVKIKKGLDLKLVGAVPDPHGAVEKASPVVAVIPDDFIGFVPKPAVREGDKVLSGQPLFFDKLHPEMKLVSPASGTVRAVVRGERRKLLRIEVAVDGGGEALKHDVSNAFVSGAGARKLLLESGVWAMMSQRPYAVVPDPNAEIRDVFVSCFDSAPLAENPVEFSQDERRFLEAGVKILALVSKGKVYVSYRKCQQMPALPGAEMVVVEGPHPAGNVGTQIAAIRPVNKGETVLCLNLATLMRAGAVALTGVLPTETVVALTGSEMTAPKMVHTLMGAEMSVLLDGEVKDDGCHHRIISGNVLTGIATAADGFLHFPYDQVTVIPEGDDVDEFMGWASVSLSKMSVSPSFPARFLGRRKFSPDARLLGGRRAMIMSGEYDKVMPLDILPEYLLKAILSRDIDRMEQLGIYEVAPEDFALAEYVDTSKLELQKIVREGLDYLRKELE